MQRALERGSIMGVYFPKVGLITLHNMYADDMYAVLRACLRYILAFQCILIQFGKVSGLHFAWEYTVASYIPARPPPPELRILRWKWEDNNTASPLVGAPVAQSIAQGRLEGILLEKIAKRINKIKERGLTLAARIVVANSLIMGCLWYFLILWAGDAKFLKRLQREVDRFIWGGRSWVAGAICTLKKMEGGLGLINIAAQYRALSGTLMIWVALQGEHPLWMILQSHIGGVSQRRWGIADLSWLVSQCGSMQMAGSITWRSLCRGWESLRKHL